MTLTPASGPVLRVPVYATARPISNMTTVETSLNITSGDNTGSQTLTLAGTPVTRARASASRPRSRARTRSPS